MTCPGNITAATDANASTYSGAVFAVSTIDSAGIDSVEYWAAGATSGAVGNGTAFAVGETSVRATVEDKAGNNVSCVFFVTVTGQSGTGGRQRSGVFTWKVNIRSGARGRWCR